MRAATTALCVMFLGALLLGLACSDEGTRPRGPCYSISAVFESGIAPADTVAARSAFEAYLLHLSESGESPAFGYSQLAYARAGRQVQFQGSQYWGIVAIGSTGEAPPALTTAFCVRDDGTVVLMLGCI